MSSDLAVILSLSALLDGLIEPSEVVRKCRAMGGPGSELGIWALKSVLTEFEDHGFSQNPLPTFVDAEVISATSYLLNHAHLGADACSIIDQQTDGLATSSVNFGLYQTLRNRDPKWPEFMPFPDRLRFTTSLITRLIRRTSLIRKMPASTFPANLPLKPIELRCKQVLQSVQESYDRKPFDFGVNRSNGAVLPLLQLYEECLQSLPKATKR